MITKNRKEKKEPTFNSNRAKTQDSPARQEFDAEVGRIKTYDQEKIASRNKTYREKAMDTINLEFGEEFNKNKNHQNHNNDNRNHSYNKHSENSNKQVEFGEEFEQQNQSRNKKNDRHGRNATLNNAQNSNNMECGEEFCCKEESKKF